MRPQFKLFSLSVLGLLLLSLAFSFFGPQAMASTPEPFMAEQTMHLDIGVCNPKAGPFSLKINNPFYPLPEGRVWVLKGEEDGEKVRLRITVLDKTENVAGV